MVIAVLHNLEREREGKVSVHTPLKTLDNQGFLIGQSKVFFNHLIPRSSAAGSPRVV